MSLKKTSAFSPPAPVLIPPVDSPSSGRGNSASLFFLYLFGWGLVSFFFLALQQFHPIHLKTTGISNERLSQCLPFFWFALGLLAWVFIRTPMAAPAGDIGRKASRFLLFMILVLAAFMRLYEAGSPAGHYWEDCQLAIIDACRLTDYNKFFVFGFYQDGEPLYAYVIALVMRFFPGLEGIFVQRLVLALFDLGTIWIVYLAGKELGKRRIGLLAASFAAVSKPMLMMNLSYMRYGTVQLAVALVLLFSLRLFKKPTFAHFLQWGASLALGYYTYTAFQTLSFFFIFAMLLWVLFREKATRFRFQEWFLGWGLMGFLALLFLYSHRAALKEESVFRTLVLDWLGDKKFILLLALVLVWALVQNLRSEAREKSGKSMAYYVLSLFMALVLVYPAFRAGVSGYLGVPFLDETRGFSFEQTVGNFTHRAYLAFLSVFYSGMDRGDINLYGDAFFGVTDLIFIFPGIVLVILWPTGPRLFVLLCALAGLAPRILADPGGNRLVGCIVPLMLVGALGFNHLMETASLAFRPAIRKALLMALWLGLLAFGGYTTFVKVHLVFNKDRYNNLPIVDQIRKDSVLARVYSINDQAGPVGIMNEQYLFYELWKDSNPICLEPSEEKPDVVVLLQESYLPNLSLQDLPNQLKSQFPGAQWSKTRLNSTHVTDSPINLLRIFIPKDQLSEDPSKIIYVRRLPKIRWTRRVYFFGYRMGYGAVVGEDRVADLAEPFPDSYKKFDPIPSIRCIGDFNAPRKGKYRFAVETDNMTDFWVDGKRIIRLRPNKKTRAQESIRLSQGSHHIEITTRHPRAVKLPETTVLFPGSKEWKPL